MDAPERDALRAAARGFLDSLADRSTAPAMLASAATFDRAAWQAMAKLGLQGAAVAEELGGAGLGAETALLVHEEAGRALYGGPFLATVGQVLPGLQALGDVAGARARIRRIAAGELTAAAVVPLDAPAGLAAILGGPAAVTLSRAGDGWELNGSLPCVIDAELADGLLVIAAMGSGAGSGPGGAGSGPGGARCAGWADAAAPGVRIEPLPAVDLTRRMARVSFSATPAEPLAVPGAGGTGGAGTGGADAAAAAVTRGMMLALAAECVGLAGQALELTVGYVRDRRQFGRPVGSFQAVKHRCAEMLVQLEAARSALYLASDAAAVGHEAAARLAAVRICAGEAAFAIANEAIHLHGGIGFTWEYPLHLYYRRAKSNQQLLDSSGGQRAELAARAAAIYAEQERAS